MGVVSRLAPSPTGLVHLGHARTFLVAWLSARSQRGRVLLRHEDLDQERSRDSYAVDCERDLRWLGLDWDGPPSKQSEHAGLFSAAALKLTQAGATYPCVCTRAEVRAAIAAPHTGDSGDIYPGTCKGLFESIEEAKSRTGRDPALRYSVDEVEVEIFDALTGAHKLSPFTDFGDFPITSRDGHAAYHLAVVVDDAHQGVTEVVRGDDLLTSSGPQALLQDALGLQRPNWLHVPLVLDHDAKRLAKRSDSVSLALLRDSGVDPRELVAWLAKGLGLGDFGAISPQELISYFSPGALSREPLQLPADLLGALSS